MDRRTSYPTRALLRVWRLSDSACRPFDPIDPPSGRPTVALWVVYETECICPNRNCGKMKTLSPRSPRKNPRIRAEGLAGANSKRLVGAYGLIETQKIIKNLRVPQNKRPSAKRLRTRRLLAAHRAVQNKSDYRIVAQNKKPP